MLLELLKLLLLPDLLLLLPGPRPGTRTRPGARPGNPRRPRAGSRSPTSSPSGQPSRTTRSTSRSSPPSLRDEGQVCRDALLLALLPALNLCARRPSCSPALPSPSRTPGPLCSRPRTSPSPPSRLLTSISWSRSFRGPGVKGLGTPFSNGRRPLHLTLRDLHRHSNL